ncbi:MAG: hypothetical protein ACR2N6_00470 [Miltoncostaeaceae bacterium]
MRRSAPEAARRYLRDDVVWLDSAGRGEGIEGAVAGLTAALRATEALTWDEPQRHGAHAVLRWSEGDRRGGLVVETRRGAIVLLVAVP